MVIAVGHLNNDRQLDIAVINKEAESVGILFGNGDGSFHVQSVFSTGFASNPYSIVLGDFNNDNRLDIAVANYGGNNVGVFLQYDNGKYSPQMTYSTGNESYPMSLAVGDFNNDGQLDITVANSGTGNVGVLFGNGSGKFLPQVEFSIGVLNRPVAITAADFNNDGRLDIAVAIRVSNTVGILLGHSGEIFQDIKMFSAGFYAFPASLAVGDFNSDGNWDIAVGNTNNKEEHVLILLGDGEGNFSHHGKYMTENDFKLCSVVVGNFNGDRRLDMAVIHSNTMEIGVFFGYGDGTFSKEIEYSTDNHSAPVSIAVGDFNNDNLTDLAVANDGTYSVSIFLAFMDTNFINNSTWSTGSAASPGAVVLGDFSNDGQLDILIGNEGTHDIDILRNNGNGHFSIHSVHSGDSSFFPTSIVVADFNNDNQLDIAVANSIMSTITLLYGKGNNTFGNLSVFSTGMNSHPQSIATGDFNSDNRTDLVVAYFGTGSIGLFLKIDNGAPTSLTLLPTGYESKPHAVTVADFDKDGHLDIVVANNGNANIGFFFGLGNGTFSEQNTILLGTDVFPIWVGHGDFNNDQHLDIVVSSNVIPSPVIVLLGNGDRSFRLRRIDGVNATYMGALGDLNADSYLDVVFCQPWFDVITVLLGNGNGTFRDPVRYSTGNDSFPSAIVVGEFNNDNRLDIAVANPNQKNIGVFFGYGDGTFSSQTVHSTKIYGVPFSMVAGDFNHDNWLDIAIGIHGPNNTGILFGNGNGTFLPLITNPTGNGSLPQCIDAADFNNDGRLDIVITNSDSYNVGIILGHVNGSFFNEITYSTGDNSYPYWTGLGDFNNDGRLDIAVANMLSDNIAVFFGYSTEDFISTATKQIGDSSQPVSIAVGDFNNDTHLDVVVADRGTNEIVILQGSGYGTFTNQQTYSTGDGSYPNWVTVDDFNHDQYLDIAVVNSGTSNIAVFLGDGNGTFSDSIKSSTGKSSLPLSLSVGYFNNDTHLDMVVADFGTNNVCLLFGYGNGYFGSLECHTSGYDSRPFGVASGDMNGDNKPDVVITNKESSTIKILTKIC